MTAVKEKFANVHRRLWWATAPKAVRLEIDDLMQENCNLCAENDRLREKLAKRSDEEWDALHRRVEIERNKNAQLMQEKQELIADYDALDQAYDRLSASYDEQVHGLQNAINQLANGCTALYDLFKKLGGDPHEVQPQETPADC
jgi:regulator of replication initiation timing